MSEEEKRSMQQPTEEEEESGDDDDMGKYMIDDDDDDLPAPVPKKDKSEKKIDTEDQKKELFSAKELRDYMAASVPGLKKHRGSKLPVHGNERTMNLNHMVLANITESAYFRCDLLQIKTYDDMIDEIYYKVTHLEPWEKVGIKKAFYRQRDGC
ncbi:Oidioi.mRNA.OKI2018_I69.PAR.g11036.t2.cds [Oikopleura dioica]|uniref:Pre-mRNA-splicing factor 38 n=1 Tax=Oikopleura dioica TaxID=34765 RepID=A0ABN7RYN8_OIKDI|nr:Oidioi.mRNA.OKI2018_I69.PAR.g11036.t2.cds [Oikopleura dioica]